MELRLFDKLAEGDGKAKMSAQLAEMTGADPILLSIFKTRSKLPIRYRSP